MYQSISDVKNDNMTELSNRNAIFLSVLEHQQQVITEIVNVELAYYCTMFSFSPAVPFLSVFPAFHLFLYCHLFIFILRQFSRTTPVTEYRKVFDSGTLSNFTTHQKWQDTTLAFCLSGTYATNNCRQKYGHPLRMEYFET